MTKPPLLLTSTERKPKLLRIICTKNGHLWTKMAKTLLLQFNWEEIKVALGKRFNLHISYMQMAWCLNCSALHTLHIEETRSFFSNLKIQAGARCVLGYDGFEILQCKVSQSRDCGMANWTRVCVQEHLGQNCVRAGRAQPDKIQKCKKYKVQKYGRVCLVQEDPRQKCPCGGGGRA